MSKKNDDITNLIDKLAAEDKNFKPICPYRRLFFWAVFSIAYLTAYIAYFEIRYDIKQALENSNFLFEMTLSTALFISSILTASWLCFPDACQKKSAKAVPLTLFAVFISWIGIQSIAAGTNPFDHMGVGHCASEGLFVQLFPFIALIIITIMGRTTQPYLLMAMNVIAISTLGWISMRLTCSMDDMGHAFINHFLPFAVIGGAIGLFSRKIFRW